MAEQKPQDQTPDPTDQTQTGDDVSQALEALESEGQGDGDGDDGSKTGTPDKPMQKLQQDFGTLRRQMEQQNELIQKLVEQSAKPKPDQAQTPVAGDDDGFDDLDDTEIIEGRHLKQLMARQMKAITAAIKPLQKQMRESDKKTSNEQYEARLIKIFPDAKNDQVADTLIDLADKRLATYMPDLTGSEREAALRATLLQVAGEAAARMKSKGKGKTGKPRTPAKSTEGTEIVTPGATQETGDSSDEVEQGRREIEEFADTLDKALRAQ